MTFVVFIIFIYSIITIFTPRVAWYLSIGWKFKNSEPSDGALVFQRLSGIVVAIVTFIIIVNNISNSVSTNSWPNKFLYKVTVENVDKIIVGDSKGLSSYEIEGFVKVINDVKMRKGPQENGFGYSKAINIVFKDGTGEIIYDTGSYFKVRPYGMDIEYSFDSLELQQLINKKWLYKNYFIWLYRRF